MRVQGRVPLCAVPLPVGLGAPRGGGAGASELRPGPPVPESCLLTETRETERRGRGVHRAWSRAWRRDAAAALWVWRAGAGAGGGGRAGSENRAFSLASQSQLTSLTVVTGRSAGAAPSARPHTAGRRAQVLTSRPQTAHASGCGSVCGRGADPGSTGFTGVWEIFTYTHTHPWTEGYYLLYCAPVSAQRSYAIIEMNCRAKTCPTLHAYTGPGRGAGNVMVNVQACTCVWPLLTKV